MENYKKRVLEELISEFKEENFTKTFLAEELDVNISTISRWFQGKQFPSPEKFHEIADIVLYNITDLASYKEGTMGQKLFLLRNWEGLTRKEMANSIGFGHILISSWEKDKKTPNDNQLKRLISFFYVRQEDLNANVSQFHLGKNIQEQRVALGLTQEELGMRINRSTSVVSSYERNVTVPPKNILFKLSTALEVPIYYLISDEEGHVNAQFIDIRKELYPETCAEKEMKIV